MRASRSLIVNPIAGDTLVIDLESLAFKGRWILPNLVGGVDQMRDIDRAVLLKKSVTVVFGASTRLFDAQFGKDGFGYLQRWLATKELTEPARTFSLEEVRAPHEWMGSGRSEGKIAVII
jgi:hypothetical protein